VTNKSAEKCSSAWSSCVVPRFPGSFPNTAQRSRTTREKARAFPFSTSTRRERRCGIATMFRFQLPRVKRPSTYGRDVALLLQSSRTRAEMGSSIQARSHLKKHPRRRGEREALRIRLGCGVIVIITLSGLYLSGDDKCLASFTAT